MANDRIDEGSFPTD